MKKITILLLLLLVSASIFATSINFVGAGVMKNNKSEALSAGILFDYSSIYGNNEKIRFSLTTHEECAYIFGTEEVGSNGFYVSAFAGVGAYYNPFGGFYVQPEVGVGLTGIRTLFQDRFYFDLTAGTKMNFGYAFGESQAFRIGCGLMVQYSLTKNKTLYYSGYVGIGRKF